MKISATPTYFSKKALKKMGFKITGIYLYKTTEGQLVLNVNWTASKDEYKVRYGDHICTGSGRNDSDEYYECIDLEFPQVPAPYGKKDYKATLTIEIKYDSYKQSLYYGLKHVDKTKYGCIIYICPNKWELAQRQASL